MIAVPLILSAVLTVYTRLDPEEYNFFPKCLFHSLTGLKCPGCGSQRAIHQLLNGNLVSALHYNALAVIAIPYLSVGLVLLSCRRPGPFISSVRDLLYHGKTVYIVLFLIIVFWILRNIIPGI